MIKRDEVAIHESCFNRAYSDEPLFVLRANDPLAPEIVEEWAKVYDTEKRSKGITEAQINKCREARELANQMRKWRRENRA